MTDSPVRHPAAPVQAGKDWCCTVPDTEDMDQELDTEEGKGKFPFLDMQTTWSTDEILLYIMMTVQSHVSCWKSEKTSMI